MPTYKTEDIRSVALVGHEVAGKTSLADALLYKAKAVDRRGCVDDGTSVSDYDDEEKKQMYSIDSSILFMDYQGKRIYLIDCPGKPDFVGQALGGLNAVEPGGHRHLGPVRHSGQHPPHVRRGGQARHRPSCGHQPPRQRQHSL